MIGVKKAFKIPKSRITSGDVGVEIEVEGDNLPDVEQYWRAEHDGSLRGESIEYVLRKPLDMPQVRDSLSYLNTMYLDNDTVVHESVRAGVHVHINVQELTMVELYSFITAYIILEDILIKYCGEYREGNLFCLRMRDAEYLLYELEQVASDKDYSKFQSDILRYSSLNVCSLWNYGSLEFRAMRGTRDLDIIGDWAEILLNLRNESLKFETPAQIVEMLQEHGAESFLETFLGTFKDKLCNDVDWEELINEGLYRAYQLAMSTDWESFKMKNIGGLYFSVDTEYPDAPMEDY